MDFLLILGKNFVKITLNLYHMIFAFSYIIPYMNNFLKKFQIFASKIKIVEFLIKKYVLQE